jgi:hypothetical protein
VFNALPATTMSTVSGGPGSTVTAVDVDDAYGRAVLGYSVDTRFGQLTLSSLTVTTTTVHAPTFPPIRAWGVAIDGANDLFFAYDQGSGVVEGTRFLQMSGFGAYGCATDRVRHRAVLPELGSVTEVDLVNGSTGTPLTISSGGFIGINPAVWGNLVAMIVAGGAADGLTLVDMAGMVVGGDIDAPRARYCGAGDRVAVDPSRNRAFVTNSCSQKLEGYNLNVIFVK